jgi:hypothetical protein
MSAKIKVLKTNGISGLIIHELGKNGVTEICDFSVDAEQNYVVAYGIYIDKKLKHRYENGTFEIEYQS